MIKNKITYPFLSGLLAVIVLLFFVFDTNESKAQADVDIQVQNFRIDNSIQLEKDMLYELFTASENYITWLEFYTKSLYFLDLSDKSLKAIPLVEGNGPNEYNALLGLTIVNDIAYLLSSGNMKLIRYDLENETYLDDISLSRPVFSLTNLDQLIISVNMGGGSGPYPLFSTIDPQSGEVKLVDNSMVDSNPMTDGIKFAAKYYSNSNYILRLSLYSPSIILYDKTSSVLSEFYYDQVELPRSNLQTPNLELEMKTIDAALNPHNNMLYLVKEGKSKNKEFTRSTIYSIDLDQKTYSPIVIETPKNSIKEIFLNSNFMFLYDDSEHMLYWMSLN